MMKLSHMMLAVPLFSMAMGIPAPAFADVKAGVEAWERGDFAGAIKQWRGPALKGDADAQFNLGQAYKLGRGVPMDLAIAEDWFKRAADQGHLQAADNYGLILFQGNRRSQAIPYIKASAERGEPRAQYVLGTAHFNGDLMNKDWVRAYALMTRASAAGLPQASQSLSTMDQYIPLADRQQGLALSAQLERDADRLRNQQYGGLSAPSTALPPVSGTAPAQALPTPVQTAQLPASQVAQPAPAAVSISAPAPASPIVQPIAAEDESNLPLPDGYIPSVPAPNANTAVTAGADFARPAMPVSSASAPLAAAPDASVATSGDWRIQLGAFSTQSKAEALWNSLEANSNSLDGLQPYLVKSGDIIRLQAGPYASKDAADRACAALSGKACFAVKN